MKFSLGATFVVFVIYAVLCFLSYLIADRVISKNKGRLKVRTILLATLIATIGAILVQIVFESFTLATIGSEEEGQLYQNRIVYSFIHMIIALGLSSLLLFFIFKVPFKKGLALSLIFSVASFILAFSVYNSSDGIFHPKPGVSAQDIYKLF